MSRLIVALADDDPTLAAQAHAAIRAVPGVVGVEEIGTHAGIGLATGGMVDAVLAYRESVHTAHPLRAVPPPYTVTDEDDGAP